MSEWKVTASHRSRAAVIYVRQSTLVQVERNRESTARQYDLVSRARELGWPRTAVTVIDEDLGVSGASAAGRSGFAQLAAQVGMGQVGMVLSLECSRLARNNADWYRLTCIGWALQAVRVELLGAGGLVAGVRHYAPYPR